MDIQQVAHIIAYILFGLVVAGAIFFSIRKAIKTKDPAKIKGTVSQWLDTIFSAVEALYPDGGSGALKFQAAKNLILQKGLFPDFIKKLLGSPEFDKAAANFIETELRKRQDVWIAAGEHKPHDN